MLTIQKNLSWKKFEKVFEKKSILKRYDWFLFEFGKRITQSIHKELLGKIEEIKGTQDYVKRLVIAEVRTTDRAWFAIAARSQSASEQKKKSESQILKVVQRFKIPGVRDPIKDILVDYGPWTEESIPFSPSLRQAAIVVQEVEPSVYKETLNKNMTDIALYTELMSEFKIGTEPRADIQKKLKLINDLDVQALNLEYVKESEGKPHWRPSIKNAKTQGIRKLMKDRDLIRAMVDPTFSKWRSKKHLRTKLSSAELNQFEKFQRLISKGT